MAVEGITAISQNIADQQAEPLQRVPAEANAPASAREAPREIQEDTFTPSSESGSANDVAQEARIFQANPENQIVIPANPFFAPLNSLPNQNGAPAQSASGTATNAGTVQTAATVKSATQTHPGQLFAHPPGSQQPAPVSPLTANVQVQIEALNESLPALKLTKEDIQEIDRIATVEQNFNPGAYTNLVSQFEEESQLPAQNSTAAAAIPIITTASNSAGTDANAKSAPSQTPNRQ